VPRTITNKFNRGEIDERALTRDDVEEVHNTCELMENWLPRRGGWMQYRPGTEALGACKSNASHRIIPFVDDGDVPTLLEFSSSSANPSVETVRIWSNDALLEVTSTADSIVNDDFATDIVGWGDDSAGSGSTAWSSEHGGSARIVGGNSAGDSGALYQTVSTTAGERTIELFVDESQILLQIGTNGARSNDVFEGLLSPGYHMITFTADGSNVTYTLSNTNAYYGYVEYLQYKASGTFELTGPFFTSTTTDGAVLETARYTQINDVLFLTSSGYYIEGFAWPLVVVRRWSTKSWSFELPEITDGPFGPLNETPITLTPSATSGNGNLTASNAFFTDPGHVGRKYKLVHGSTEGICEVLSVTSDTVATIRILKSFGGATATRDWYEGRLAYYLPGPTTVDVYQNRLWLAGGARVYGSTSDLFLSFDETIEGDSAAIQKTIALGPVQEISWLAGGDELFIGLTAEEMRDQIAILLGGRVAEELVLGSISSGAFNDLERATEIAHTMVARLGMSEKLGPVVWGRQQQMQYLNSAQTLEERNFSDATAQTIDAEVKALLEQGRERAHEILARCRGVHARLTAELEEKETLDAEDVLRLAQECHQGTPQRDGG